MKADINYPLPHIRGIVREILGEEKLSEGAWATPRIVMGVESIRRALNEIEKLGHETLLVDDAKMHPTIMRFLQMVVDIHEHTLKEMEKFREEARAIKAAQDHEHGEKK